MKRNHWTRIAPLAFAIPFLLPTGASAAPPSPDNGGYETFICPAVSLHNDRGTWVIGAHGAYYVNIVTRGTPEPMKASKVFVKVGEDQGQAVERAQVPAGYALYNKAFPDAFDADGSASSTSGFYTNDDPSDAAPEKIMLLGEGLTNWLGDPAGWAEGDMATVESNNDGSYTVTNLGGPMGMVAKGETVTVSPIPLAAGVFW
ncbi:MAG: hypothetical protein ACQERF_04920 [Actinomycetota bacterium]